MDFYRELGDLFAVPLASHNRWAGFKALRMRWADHIGSSRCRPVLIIDEAQEALTPVLCELRILASKELDSKQLLCVVFAGDARLPERLRSPELQPLGSRIRRRLNLDYASRDELPGLPRSSPHCRRQSSLMTSELRVTLADHAAGNYRVLINLADELLAVAADRELARLDESSSSKSSPPRLPNPKSPPPHENDDPPAAPSAPPRTRIARRGSRRCRCCSRSSVPSVSNILDSTSTPPPKTPRSDAARAKSCRPRHASATPSAPTVAPSNDNFAMPRPMTGPSERPSVISILGPSDFVTTLMQKQSFHELFS